MVRWRSYQCPTDSCRIPEEWKLAGGSANIAIPVQYFLFPHVFRRNLEIPLESTGIDRNSEILVESIRMGRNSQE